jgi:uncharacterized protein
MGRLNFQRARHYALARLMHELSPALRYHSLAHTRDDVVPAAERLAILEGIDGEALVLVRTAAYYHDLGFVVQRADHEGVSAQIAAAILPDYGYTPAHIQVICGMIMATRLPQTPHTLLEQIVADADLDVLGRPDFVTRNQDLHAELAAFEAAVDDCDWYRIQLAFLRDHRYWTSSARRLREERKQRNIAALADLLEGCQRSR